MTTPQLGAFLALLFTIVTFPLVVLYGAPHLARIRFVHKVEVIRDQCSDALLDERLPNSPEVERFLARTEWLAENANLLTLTRAFTMYAAIVQYGFNSSHRKDHDDFTDEGLIDLKARLQSALVTYFLNGSPLGWPVATLLWLARAFGKKLPAKDAKLEKVPVPSVPTLAQETVTSVIDRDYDRMLLGVG